MELVMDKRNRNLFNIHLFPTYYTMENIFASPTWNVIAVPRLDIGSLFPKKQKEEYNNERKLSKKSPRKVLQAQLKKIIVIESHVNESSQKYEKPRKSRKHLQASIGA